MTVGINSPVSSILTARSMAKLLRSHSRVGMASTTHGVSKLAADVAGRDRLA